MLTKRQRLNLWGPVIGGALLAIAALGTASATDRLFQVGPIPSQTVVSSSVNPSVVGQAVTYKAKVSDDPDDGVAPVGVPTGIVDFVQGDTTICDDVALTSTGEASCARTYTTARIRTIVASYSGDSNFGASKSPRLTQTVNKAVTATALSSSDGDNKTVSGQQVTYTARVSVKSPGSGALTGAVTFKDGDTVITGCGSRALSSASATCVTKFPVANGTHTVTAVFLGTSNFRRSTSKTITQTVGRASTQTALRSSKNPAFSVETVTYKATVTVVAPGSGRPSGRVVFKDGGNPIAACSGKKGQPLNSLGYAKCSVDNSRVGSHAITAHYRGSWNFIGDASSSMTQVFKYKIRAWISSGSAKDPRQGAFRISGVPHRDYRLCVKYDDTWPAKTPPPADGATRYTLNQHYKCKTASWSTGLASSRKLGSTFGFATKGTYRAVWFMNGNELGTDTLNWNSWCPPGPTSFRQLGVWRPSRHKVIDSCRTSTGVVAKTASISNLDEDKGWRWTAGLGTIHVEYVARDRLTRYGAPSSWALGEVSPGVRGNKWTLTGVLLCDTFHGVKEFHPVFRATRDGVTYISGPQYSIKAPSISGTWSAHAC